MSAVQSARSHPEVARKLVRAFVASICRRRTEDSNPDHDRRACHDLARRLVARDPGLASRLHDILGLDRVGIDVDDDEGHGPALVLWGRCHGVPGFQKEQRRRQDALADRGQVG